MEKKIEYNKSIPNPGKCPACYTTFCVTENGYYCSHCGYMGWFTHDQWYED